jgi:hypothetical protein
VAGCDQELIPPAVPIERHRRCLGRGAVRFDDEPLLRPEEVDLDPASVEVELCSIR